MCAESPRSLDCSVLPTVFVCVLACFHGSGSACQVTQRNFVQTFRVHSNLIFSSRGNLYRLLVIFTPGPAEAGEERLSYTLFSHTFPPPSIAPISANLFGNVYTTVRRENVKRLSGHFVRIVGNPTTLNPTSRECHISGHEAMSYMYKLSSNRFSALTSQARGAHD